MISVRSVLEDYVTIKHGGAKPQGHLFDFATIIPEDECQMGDGSYNHRCAGLLYETKDGDEEVSDHSPDPNAAWFPSSVSIQGIRLDVRNAKASRAADEKNIMRWIQGYEDEINLALRKKFARPAAYMAATEVDIGDGEVDASLSLLREIVESGLLGYGDDLLEALEDQEILVDCASYASDSDSEAEELEESEIEHAKCLKYLLQMKCSPDSVNAQGVTALEVAIGNESWRSARILLEHGANPNFRGADSWLADRTWLAKVPKDIAKLLMDAGLGFDSNEDQKLLQQQQQQSSSRGGKAGYKKDWCRLSVEERRAAELCGYNQRSWDEDEDMPIDQIGWRRLHKKQRKALQVLGYTQQTWDSSSSDDD